MTTTIRRSLVIGLIWLGFVAFTATPASAQVDVRYTGPGLSVPTINAPGPVGVLSETGERTQVLASQVGGVAGTAQAPVQGLAFTGADIVTLVTVGLVAIMLGAVLNRRSRPRSVATK